MKLICGKNDKDCLGASFAMATGTSLEDVVAFCGHDGSENGFESQEMLDYALSHNYATVMHLDPSVYSEALRHNINLKKRVIGEPGVIGFKFNGKHHAVASDGKTVFDPKGAEYSLEYALANKKLQIFWQLKRFCSCNSSPYVV